MLDITFSGALLLFYYLQTNDFQDDIWSPSGVYSDHDYNIQNDKGGEVIAVQQKLHTNECQYTKEPHNEIPTNSKTKR